MSDLKGAEQSEFCKFCPKAWRHPSTLSCTFPLTLLSHCSFCPYQAEEWSQRLCVSRESWDHLRLPFGLHRSTPQILLDNNGGFSVYSYRNQKTSKLKRTGKIFVQAL